MAKQTFDDLAQETMSPDLIRRSDELAREYIAGMFLREVRAMRGMSQADLASVLGVRQPSVSKLERQRDIKLSTLDNLVRALGGELRVTASFPDGEVRLGQSDVDGDDAGASDLEPEPDSA